MKRLLFLFPLYILFLSGIPCSPNDGCCQEEIEVYINQHPVDHDNTRGKKSDLPCSPLFPCGACHGIVIPDHHVQTVQLAEAIAAQPSHYIEKPLPAYTATIWQPPRQA